MYKIDVVERNQMTLEMLTSFFNRKDIASQYRGKHSDVFLIGEDTILKCYDQRYPEEKVKNELYFLNQLQSKGILVPKVLDQYIINNTLCILFEKMNGKNARDSNIPVKKIIDYFEEVNSVETDISVEKAADMWERWKGGVYYAARKIGGKVLESLVEDKLPERCTSPKVIHNDIKLDHIIQTKKGITLIDWEWVHLSYPEIDYGRLWNLGYKTENTNAFFIAIDKIVQTAFGMSLYSLKEISKELKEFKW